MSETNTRPFTAAAFNQFVNENKLMAARCSQCEATYLPPRAICPKCHGDQLEWVELEGHGRLAAFTSIYIAPSFMIDQGFGRDNPYVTGIVELAEGVKISARLLGVDAQNPASILIGIPLAVAFIQEGEKKVLAFSTVT
jgi:uncharacterized protein